MDFPRSSTGKESACNAGYLGSVTGLGRSPEGGHGNPLQYSCLENSMYRGAWWVIVHRVTKSQTQLRATSRDICGGHSSERKGCCWHLMSGGQTCCSLPQGTVYPPPQGIICPQMPIVPRWRIE